MVLLRRLLVLAIVTSAGVVHADWPVARHDMQRTGAITGTSNLRTPAAYWRQYLGGALGPALVQPLGASGEVAYLGGGRLRALSAQGVPRWQSDNLELTAIVGMGDLDGDGADELIARSIDRAFVFDATDGALRWAEPLGEMGTIGDVRLADVDGRPGRELIAQECYCCQLRSTTPGAVWVASTNSSAPSPVASVTCICRGPAHADDGSTHSRRAPAQPSAKLHTAPGVVERSWQQ